MFRMEVGRDTHQGTRKFRFGISGLDHPADVGWATNWEPGAGVGCAADWESGVDFSYTSEWEPGASVGQAAETLDYVGSHDDLVCLCGLHGTP